MGGLAVVHHVLPLHYQGRHAGQSRFRRLERLAVDLYSVILALVHHNVYSRTLGVIFQRAGLQQLPVFL